MLVKWFNVLVKWYVSFRYVTLYYCCFDQSVKFDSAISVFVTVFKPVSSVIDL